MDGEGRSSRFVRFGAYEIDRQARVLSRSGQRIPLQIQPFAVLEALVERAGEVVTREELRTRIWPASVYVDFDHGLNNAITRLRRALEDSTDSPRYIETLPRIGYRFIHAIEPEELVAPPALPGPFTSQRPSRTWTAVAAAALLIAVIAVIGGIGGIGIMGWPQVDAGRHPAGPSAATKNREAREAYLRGVELFEQRRKESVELSIEHLDRAVALDPDFAAAHAALAMSYVSAGGNTLLKYRSADEVFGPALAAAHRALQIDPDLPQAHLALAGVLNHLQPWSAANDIVIEHAYRKALSLEPQHADAHLFYGNFLSTRGRSEEAVRHFQLALESNPLSPSINSRLGMELVALGKLQQGLEYLRKTVELDPWQFNAHVRLGWGYVALGDLEAAEEAFEAAERISPDSLTSQGGLAFIAARRGDAESARTRLNHLTALAAATDSPFEVAIVYVALQDRVNAIEWLGRTARQTRTLHMRGPWGIRSPLYDWLRGDPEFAQIESYVFSTVKPGRAPGTT